MYPRNPSDPRPCRAAQQAAIAIIGRQRGPLSPVIAEGLEDYSAGQLRAFTEQILHGDDKHRAWLRNAVEQFLAGYPVPKPS